jgi:YD repeat-containing protein
MFVPSLPSLSVQWRTGSSHHRRSQAHRRRQRQAGYSGIRRITSIFAAALVAASTLVLSAPAATSEVLSGADGTTLGREPQITLDDLGVDALDELQYPDPAEGLDLIAPPEPDQQGGASVAHPLSVPRGRAGVEPDLALSYDSSGGNGWVGVGWDLSLGSIEVDTRWGVPPMCPAGGVLCGPEGQRNVESETYLLEGDMLHPTAVRSQFQPRVADRADWVRRTETEWERIIRHGDSPKNYWWEVTDKSGSTRYYGGRPDGTRDESAILSSADGAVRWGLSAVVDISGNLMTVTYAKPEGTRVGTGSSIGTGFYVSEITYTGSTKAENSPAYRVKFLRDGDVDDADPRPDVVVDASAGALEVTSDLLRRIEVVHGTKQANGSRDFSTAPGGAGVLVKAWDLHYEPGPFDKSLLTKIDQVGGDDVAGASHTFDYYDDVKFASGTYEGFDSASTWLTRSSGNDLSQVLLSPVKLSALGASETNGGGARAYFGFNPTQPSKTGSFGGSFAVNGGGTESLIEMIDLNGDQLPDKVFRTSLFDRVVKYRLNNGDGTFGAAKEITGLTRLSSEGNIGVSGGPEAYFGFSVAFNIALDVSIGAAYFEDVNNDGRADFVSDGKVLFNTPTSNGGIKFIEDSDETAVPIIRGADIQIDEAQAVRDANERQRAMSPLQDVVRRWVAPWDGVVAVTGNVTFVPPDLDPGTDPLPPGGTPYDSDGVRVAIQEDLTEHWSAQLTAKGQTVTPAGVSELQVTRGEEMWFRVGSVEDGVRDRVEWQPVVTYKQVRLTPGGPLVAVGTDTLSPDENGLDQARYDAAAEFTLAGRPGTPVLMPLRGTVRLEGELTKSAATSDDVTLIVEKNGSVVVEEPIDAGFIGTVDLEEDIDVAAPTGDASDQLVVRVAADSSIDPTVLDFRPRLYYTEAFAGNGDALPTTQDLEDNSTGQPGADGVPDVDRDGNVVHLIQVDVPWDIDIYPRTDRQVPLTSWQAEKSVDATVKASVSVLGESPSGDVVLTVKQRTGAGQPGELVAKETISLPAVVFGVATRSVEVDVELKKDAQYWFDLTVRDPALQDRVTARDVRVTWEEEDDNGNTVTVERDVEETLRWAGSQGVFPIAHRGWAYAGYRAEGRVDERIEPEAFELDVDALPKQETKPTGFDDSSFPDVSQRESFPFVPALVDVRLGNSVTSVPVWQGSKENIHGAAGSAQSSRTAADQANIVPSVAAGGSQTAPVKVGLTAPGLGLTLGVSALSGSFAAAPSFGLLDYVDMNGDSFPDYVSPEQVAFTGPTGGYLGTRSLPLDGPGVGADLTFGVSAGFGGSAIDIKGSSTGDANTPQGAPKNAGTGANSTSGSSASSGGPADKDEAGVNVGGSLGITAQFTNPVEAPAGKGAEIGKLGDRVDTGEGATWEWELADINGDGLPDRVSAGPNGVRVRFNLGYSFSQPVKWADGSFEGSESFSGEVGGVLGFNWNNKEFSGGMSLSESVDLVRWTWQDVDGDGVLDQVRKHGSGQVTVAFGSGAGVGESKPYGTLQTAEVNLVGGAVSIPTGQQPSSNRSSGVGGGVDFTIPVGPLCFPTTLCYLIINPGGSYERSLSSSEVQLVDVDGDGAPDSVKSTADGSMSVRSNLRGRTNLLKSVTNPLGGQVRIGYQRDGNTEVQPNSIWVMSSLEVDDGRDVAPVAPGAGELDSQQGDGPDVQVSTFTYVGNRYDPVEREMMGYGSVVEEQRDGAHNAAVLRKRVTNWDNDTVFTAGLVLSEELRAPNDTLLQRTVNTWEVVDVATGESKPVNRPNTATEALGLLREARGVVLTRAVEEWYSDGTLGTSTRVDFEYDGLGNVVRQMDRGLPTTTADDLVALTTYSACRDSSWVSVPATFTITEPDGTVLRHRDGSTDLCLNAVPIELVERIDDGNEAVTTMRFDAWGSYDQIAYPENAHGERYTVTYIYDEDRRTDVAHVIDSHGLEATAEFDEAGMVTERVDANGNKTTYSYDGFGRLASVRAPDEQLTAQPTVAYEYAPIAAGYAYAVARHRDRFAEQPLPPAPGLPAPPADTIDTVTFVDGLGRITQTKHDASIVQLDNDGESRADPAADEVIVSGFVKFDALGRQAAEWWPRTEPKGSLTTFQQVPAEYLPSVTTYDLRDQVTSMLIPSGDDGKDEFLTTYEHGFTGTAAAGIPAGAFSTITKDPLLNDPQRPAGEPVTGKVQRTWEDARGNLLAFEDDPEGAPALRTRYSYDRLGQLLSVVDSAGNVTAHSYDGLGRRLSSETPDAGLRSLTYDPAGNVVTEVTPNLRRDDEEIRYEYEFDPARTDRLPGLHDGRRVHLRRTGCRGERRRPIDRRH